MSNRLGKPFSILLIASLAGGILAVAANSPARADDTCLSGPKATTPRGSHWYYRVEPGTKRHCWYLGAERGKIAQKAQRPAAKPSSPAPAPDKPAETSAATPLQPSVANALAEFDGATGARDQATASPPPSDTAPSDQAAQTADTLPSAVTTRWPDPAIDANAAPAINTAQQPAPAEPVTSSPQLQDNRPATAAAAAPAPQLLGERSEPGPAVRVADAPESEASSYSMPMLLGGLAGALAFAGLLGFAAIKFGSPGSFGNLSSLAHIRRHPKSIRNVVDNGHPPPWKRRDSDIAPTSASDPLRARREIEAQSRDIMEILSRASRGATT